MNALIHHPYIYMKYIFFFFPQKLMEKNTSFASHIFSLSNSVCLNVLF